MTNKEQELLDEVVRSIYERGYADGNKSGYERGYEEADSNQCENAVYAYERGLNDAWECARKIGKVNWLTLKQIGFEIKDKEKNPSWDVVMEYSASEAITKIKDYEEKQKQTDDKIKVGDEIENDKCFAVIIHIVDEDYANAIYSYKDGTIKGRVGYINPTKYKKTGRHFSQIEEVLRMMQEEDNEQMRRG